MPRGDISARIEDDPVGLFRALADADAAVEHSVEPPARTRRSLLIGIDQAEEMTALNESEDAELSDLFAAVNSATSHSEDPLDIRLVLSARDDSIDAIRDRLASSGTAHTAIRDFRLHRMPTARFRDVIVGPAEAANRAGWPLKIDTALDTALAEAAARNTGDVGDALPILALGLQRLVANYRKPDDGTITLAPEKAEAFLEDAVRRATGDALSVAGAHTDDLRRLVVPLLATWDPRAGADGAAKRQVANAHDLFVGDRASLKPVADALVDQHLLTTSETSDGTSYEVAHEALLRVEPLGRLIYERRDTYNRAQMLEAEAEDWQRSGHVTDHLARRGGRLREAQDLLTDEDFGKVLCQPGKPVADYLAACAEVDAAECEREDRLRQAELAAAREREEAARQSEAAAREIAIAAEQTASVSRTAARRTMVGLVIASLLAIFAGGTAFYAYIQQQDAIAQRAVAEKQTSEAEKQKAVARLQAERADDAAEQAKRRQARIEALLKETLAGKQKLAEYSVEQAREELSSGNIRAAIQTILEAFPKSGSASGQPYIPEAEAVLFDALQSIRRPRFILLHEEKRTINAIRISPDGTRFFSIIDSYQPDTSIRMWSLASGQKLRSYKGKLASFSQDGAFIAIANDAEWKVVDAAGKTKGNWKVSRAGSQIESLTFHPDGTKIGVAYAKDYADLIAIDTGEILRTFQQPDDLKIHELNFSSDGGLVLAVGRFLYTARVFSVEKANVVWKLVGHSNGEGNRPFGTINTGQFSHDGKRIVTGADDSTARLWTLSKRRSIEMSMPGMVLTARFSPDGTQILLATNSGEAKIWHGHTGAELLTLPRHASEMIDADYTADGAKIHIASANGTVRLFGAAGKNLGKELSRVQTLGRIASMAMTKDGETLLLGMTDGRIEVWDLKAPRTEIAVISISPDLPEKISFSSDSRQLHITGRKRAHPIVWNVPEPLLGSSTAVNPDRNKNPATAVISERRRLHHERRTGSIVLLTPGKNKPVARVRPTNCDLGALALETLSPDGRLVAAACGNGSVRVWRVFPSTQAILAEARAALAKLPKTKP